MFIHPTGMGIRNDSKGLGHHGAPRGGREHDGVDLECKPGQGILMPFDGIIARKSLPYHNDLRWGGAYIVSKRISVKMWYFLLPNDFIGRRMKAGDVIGYAQNIGEKI